MTDQPISRKVLTGEFFEEIRRIIDFWTCKVVDNTTSGFHGLIEKDGTINSKANKGAILCSRLLWFLSEAAIYTGDSKIAMAAEHIYKYVYTFFNDEILTVLWQTIVNRFLHKPFSFMPFVPIIV